MYLSKYYSLVFTASFLMFLFVPSKVQGKNIDHQHQLYSELLKQVVATSDNKKQTRVDYQKLYSNRLQLDEYLASLSGVTKSEYDAWHAEQQLSFLINAYNGFTLKLIIDNWSEFVSGEAESIRDLGSLLTNPWQKSFFTLLGDKRSLDDVEHKMIRVWFTRPRIHVALVCAAVSCPPLRAEAYMAEKLRMQLDDQMGLFLSDDLNNEVIISGDKAKVELSSIFKWYGGDFEKGQEGFRSLHDLLIQYVSATTQGYADAELRLKAIQNKGYRISFKDYDWRLNDVANF